MKTTLTAWKFRCADTAEVAAQTLRDLARESLLVVHDAATVAWEPGATRPLTSQLYPITGLGTLGTTFWGRLFGLLFFVPHCDEVNDPLSRALADQGIDDHFITRVRDGIMPGTSALFVMSPYAVVDKIQCAFAEQGTPDLTVTNLRHGLGRDELPFHDW